jgi:hypothetical protein
MTGLITYSPRPLNPGNGPLNFYLWGGWLWLAFIAAAVIAMAMVLRWGLRKLAALDGETGQRSSDS